MESKKNAVSHIRFYRPTKAGRKGIISSYRTVVSTPDLILQERKKQSKKNPNYRIITRVGQTSYIIWHGDTMEKVMEKEWNYITNDLPKLFPPDYVSGTKKARDWILEHFSNLSIDTSTDDMNVIWSDVGSSGGEEEEDEESKEKENDKEKEKDDVDSLTETFPESPESGKNTIKKSPFKNRTPKMAAALLSKVRSLKLDDGLGSNSATSSPMETKNKEKEDLKNKPPLSPHPVKSVLTKRRNSPVPNILKAKLSTGNNKEKNETKSGRLIRCFGALIATNCCIQLLLDVEKDQQVFVILLINMFIMYVVLGQDLFNLESKQKKIDLNGPLKSSTSSTAIESDSSSSSSLNSTNLAQGQIVLKFPNAGSTMLLSNVEEPTYNSFSKIPASTFDVRAGPDYAKNKKKEPSMEAFYDVICCDVFETTEPRYEIFNLVNLPENPIGKGRTGDVPNMFIFNGMLPNYSPTMWGSDRADSDRPGHQLVAYAHLSSYALKQLKGEIPMTEAMKLLQNFCRNYTDLDVLNRMKLIPIIANPDHSLAKVGLASKSVMKTYNGTPVLLRPEHKVVCTNDVFNLDFSSHDFTYLTRKTMFAVRELIPEFCIDLGLVIQGNEDDELPENILFCCRFNHVNNTSTAPRLVAQ